MASTASGGQVVGASRAPRVKRETIQRVMGAARAEFAAKGLAKARVDDIARAAGVTKQLVYHYFESKEMLFAAVIDDLSGELMGELLAQQFDHQPPSEAMKAFLTFVFEQYRSRPMLGALALEGIRYHETNETPHNRFLDFAPALTRKLSGILARGEAMGLFRGDVEPAKFLAAAVLVMTGCFTNRHTVSVIAALETSSPQGMSSWRDFSIELVMASLRRAPL